MVDRLNELVMAEGGRIYLTKDTFTRPEHFRAMEPRLEAFNRIRRQWDPDGVLRSANRSASSETNHEEGRVSWVQREAWAGHWRGRWQYAATACSCWDAGRRTWSVRPATWKSTARRQR